MKSIAYRDLGDPRGILYVYEGPLANMPGQPTHVRRVVAGLRELRGTAMCAVGLVRGSHYRRLFVRTY